MNTSRELFAAFVFIGLLVSFFVVTRLNNGLTSVEVYRCHRGSTAHLLNA